MKEISRLLFQTEGGERRHYVSGDREGVVVIGFLVAGLFCLHTVC